MKIFSFSSIVPNKWDRGRKSVVRDFPLKPGRILNQIEQISNKARQFCMSLLCYLGSSIFQTLGWNFLGLVGRKSKISR